MKKPSERIKEIFIKEAQKDGRQYKFLRSSNVEKAIMQYLDEEYDKLSHHLTSQ